MAAKGATKPSGDPVPAALDESVMGERLPINLVISRRAKIILRAHAQLKRATASALVERLILEHLRELSLS